MSITSWFQHFRNSAGTPAPPPSTPHYPPKLELIDAVRPHDIVSGQAQLIDRLRLAYGADAATFDRDVLQTLMRFAHCVHLLPATKDSHYRSPGGLFRLGLETAFFALQGADSLIFPGRQTISQRVSTEPRWRYATVLAGLCSQLHRTFSSVQVFSESSDAWPAYSLPLYDWLKTNNHKRYSLRWDDQPMNVPALSVLALNRVVSPDTLPHLAKDNRDIVPTLLAAISSTADPRGGNILDLLVRRSISLVLERDLRLNPPIAPPTPSSAIEEIIVDAMTRLVHSGAWTVNTDKARLWLGADGLFLIWPNALDDLIRYFDEARMSSAPRTPQLIEDILSARGDLSPSHDNGHLFTIYPPPKHAPKTAIRFSSPSLLLERLPRPPTALAFSLSDRPSDLSSHEPASSPSLAPASAASPQPPVRLSLVSSQPDLPLEDTNLPSISPTTPFPPASSHVTLDLPSNLNPAIRDRLSALVATASISSTPTQCSPFIESGNLFIPLPILKSSGLDPAATIGALAETGALITHPDRPAHRTHSRHIDDVSVSGILLSSSFLR